jgi:hypothetical protein
MRVGEVMRAGAEHYGENNWAKGIPISRCIASLHRHLLQYEAGATDEDHIANLVCNAAFIMHFETMIRRGLLPKELDDMPKYGSKK